eukprot:SAG22_NODE_911_length_6541_cov_6.161285_2_plen_110_part_00
MVSASAAGRPSEAVAVIKGFDRDYMLSWDPSCRVAPPARAAWAAALFLPLAHTQYSVAYPQAGAYRWGVKFPDVQNRTFHGFAVLLTESLTHLVRSQYLRSKYFITSQR